MPAHDLQPTVAVTSAKGARCVSVIAEDAGDGPIGRRMTALNLSVREAQTNIMERERRESRTGRSEGEEGGTDVVDISRQSRCFAGQGTAGAMRMAFDDEGA